MDDAPPPPPTASVSSTYTTPYTALVTEQNTIAVAIKKQKDHKLLYGKPRLPKPFNASQKPLATRMGTFRRVRWDERSKPSISSLAHAGFYSLRGVSPTAGLTHAGMYARRGGPQSQHRHMNPFYVEDDIERRGGEGESSSSSSTTGPDPLASPDALRCFQCGLGFERLFAQFNPYIQHAKFKPNCPYLKSIIHSDFIQATQLAHREEEAAAAALAAASSSSSSSTTEVSSEEQSCQEQQDLMSKIDQKHEGMEMAKNGYTNLHSKFPMLCPAVQDVLKCQRYLPRVVAPVVDQILQTPESDGGGMAGLVTNENLLRKLTDMDRNQEEPLPRRPSSREDAFQQLTDRARVKYPTSDELETATDKIKDSFLCNICFTLEKRIVFVPCGHMSCCVTCAIACNNCPVCRKEIKGSIHLQ